MFIKLDKNHIVFNDTNSEERRELINDKLVAFYKDRSPQVYKCYESENDSPDFIGVYAEVEPQKLIGGLISYIDWDWLEIDLLWIDEDYRGKGIGKYLVKSVEQKAKNNGIKKAKLCTFDFQALNFYEKLGYTVYGKLEDFPEGHTAYYLKKILLN